MGRQAGDGAKGPGHSFHFWHRIARLAIRHILCNPASTAPIPALITVEQVDNLALAIAERRELNQEERAELQRAMHRAWARLPTQ